ncbi:MAG: 4Fe-4S dicluster domain-containing protein, partial [Nitrososphaerota archaeon]|nr:4Fe-4S dicluster domain-containing protein [Nitrososphaerota archaeon]
EGRALQSYEVIKLKHAVVVELDKCVGCNACTAACKIKNKTPKDIFWRKIVEIEHGEFPDVKKTYFPLMCMHCENPECLKVCPTGATYRTADGIVLIDYDKCLGCKYCIVACPYMERFFNSGDDWSDWVSEGLKQAIPKGVVEKCDLCYDRVQDGQNPLCVDTCPYDALHFGDMDDDDSPIKRLTQDKKAWTLKEDDSYKPSVYYIGEIE